MSLLLLLSTGAADLKVASVGFKAISTDQKRVEFLSELFGQQLGEAGGFTVTTPSQIAAVVGLERQKQLLGCSEDSTSCLAEVAGALAADAVVTGQIARIGQSYAVTLKVVEATSGAELTSASTTVEGDDQLLAWLNARAREFGPRVRAKLRPDSAPVGVADGGGGGSRAVIPGAVGGVCLATAGVFYALSMSEAAKLGPGSTLSGAGAARAAAEAGQRYQLVSIVAAGVGVVAVGIAGALAMSGGGAGPQVSIAPLSGGAAVAVGGTF